MNRPEPSFPRAPDLFPERDQVKHDTRQAVMEVLTTLHQQVPEIRGTLVTSHDGSFLVYLASRQASPEQVQQLAAMASTAHLLAQQMVGVLGHDQFTRTAVRLDHADLYLYASTPQVILAVLTAADSNQPLLHAEARDAAQAVALFV